MQLADAEEVAAAVAAAFNLGEMGLPEPTPTAALPRRGLLYLSEADLAEPQFEAISCIWSAPRTRAWIRAVALLGHHSWDFTAGTYLHLDDDDLPDGAIVGDLTAKPRFVRRNGRSAHDEDWALRLPQQTTRCAVQERAGDGAGTEVD